MKTFRVYYIMRGEYGWFRDVDADTADAAQMVVQDDLGAGDYYFWRKPRELTKEAT